MKRINQNIKKKNKNYVFKKTEERGQNQLLYSAFFLLKCIFMVYYLLLSTEN